jgi:hypothetical protein
VSSTVATTIFQQRGVMTPQQIALMQGSFRSVAPIASTAVALFYDRLFEPPDMRPLFPAAISGQKLKLICMLATAVNNLHQLEAYPTGSS